MSSAWDDWHRRKEGTVEPDIAKLEELFGTRASPRILDIGCGTGRHTLYFARKGHEVYGFDESEEAIRRARELISRENLRATLQVWAMTKRFPYQDAFFDMVLATRVIHHTYMKNIIGILREIGRVTKSDGFLFLQVPSYEGEIDNDPTIKWVESGTLIAREGPEKGVPHHFFRREELLALLPDWKAEYIHSNTDHYGGYCLIARKK